MIKGPLNFLIICTNAAIISFLLQIDAAYSQLKISREQVLKDANATEILLKKYHPNLNAHRTPKQIRSIWNKAKSQLPENPNFLDAATLAQQMLAAVCDEHTLIGLNDTWNYGRGRVPGYFPTGLAIINGKLYLDDALYNSNSREIISINERKSDEIINFLRSIISADGCQNSEVLFTHHVDNQLIVSILLTNFFGSGPDFSLKYREAKTGAEQKSILPSVSLSQLGRRVRYRSIPGRSSLLKSIDIETKDRDWEFAVDIGRQTLVRSNEKKSIFYIYLPSFKGGKEQAAYIDDEMRKLVKANPDHVILDLTDNPGGSGDIAQRFLSYFLRTSSRIGITMRSRITRNISDPNYIWQSEKTRKKNSRFISQFKRVRKKEGQYQLKEIARSFGNKSYRGNLIILVSPKTGSAATIVATKAKRKSGAKIVGDIGDASMTTMCGGAPGEHLLPNSKTGIRIPLSCNDRHPGAKQREGSLLRPDVPVDIAAQNSSLTNIAILRAAIQSLDLRKVAESEQDSVKQLMPGGNRSSNKTVHKTKSVEHLSDSGGAGNALEKFHQAENKPANLSSEEQRKFVENGKTISVILTRHPFKKGRTWLGICTLDFAKPDFVAPELGDQPAVLINKIFAGSPAEKIRLQAGSFLLSVDGMEVRDTDAVIEAISNHRPGDQIEIKILQLTNSSEHLVRILHNHLSVPENRKEAALFLGNLYISGDYGDTKRPESVKYFKIAFEAGSAEAAEMLGYIYSQGYSSNYCWGISKIVERNFDVSMKYYTEAAVLGNTKSLSVLAQMYNDNAQYFPLFRGIRRSVPPNPDLAARYLLHYYQRHGRKPRDSIFGIRYLWSRDTLIASKKILHDVGIYNGDLDSEIDDDFRKAVSRLRSEQITLPELPKEFP